MKLKRREFSQSLLGVLAAASGAAAAPVPGLPPQARPALPPAVEVKLTAEQRKLYQASLSTLARQLRQMRRFPLGYSDPPASVFLAPPTVALKPSRRP